ncbi:MAG: DUF739 family protein [Lacrimispora sp.]
MTFDYSKLQGRIAEKFKSQMEFAMKMQWSKRTLSLKLTGKAVWKQPEICKALELLELSEGDILAYFFDREVQSI